MPTSVLGNVFGESAGGSFYRIKAKLDNQYVNAYSQQMPLMAGMRFQADIVQENRRIYEWMLEPLYGITKTWSAHE